LLVEIAVVLEEGEDGYVIASCPSLPGCYTQGKTEAEALANIREAIAVCLLASKVNTDKE
jgi:predicted RNase H-like HicB family nuclease